MDIDATFNDEDAAPARDLAERNAIRSYFHDVTRSPVLTPQQEVRLCEAIEAAHRALGAALLAHAPTAARLGRLARDVHDGASPADVLLLSPDGRDLDPAGITAAVNRLMKATRSGARAEPPRTLLPRLERAIADVPLRPLLLESIAGDVDAGSPGGRRVQAALAEVRALKHRLVLANLRLVVSIAKRYRHSNVPLMDLIQDGNIGLMKAVDWFQYRRGFKFSTYGTWWIRQAISRAVANTGRTIRLPVHMLATLNAVVGAQQELGRELGHDPTVADVAARSGLAPDAVHAALVAGTPVASLDLLVSDDTPLGAFQADAGVSSAEDELLRLDMRRSLRRALDSLNQRQRTVLALRYGLTDGRAQTLDEIGRRLGVSRERVRQLENQAIDRIRRRGHLGVWHAA